MKTMNTVLMEIDKVRIIRSISQEMQGKRIITYLGTFNVEKVMNTPLLKITVVEISQKGLSKPQKLDVETVFYLNENNIIEIKK